MKIVNQSFEFMRMFDGCEMLKRIEKAGRVCYKSESNITDNSAERFVAQIIKRGHESVLEHESVTVKIICDRGVSHELVRHRIASYSQESTRYCNYSNDKFGNELTFIRPNSVKSDKFDMLWVKAMSEIEKHTLKCWKMVQHQKKQEVYFLIL